jgi:hypothetical protein
MEEPRPVDRNRPSGAARPPDRAKTKGARRRPRDHVHDPIPASAHIPVLRLSRLRDLGPCHRGPDTRLRRLGEDHALSAFVIAGVIAVLAIFALTTWVWVLFDENVAKPVERLAAEMRARAHADVDEESTTRLRNTSAISARRRRRSRPT